MAGQVQTNQRGEKDREKTSLNSLLISSLSAGCDQFNTQIQMYGQIKTELLPIKYTFSQLINRPLLILKNSTKKKNHNFPQK